MPANANAVPTLFDARALLPAAPATQTFEIDCALAHQVMGPTEFLSQLHAHNGLDQQAVSESLVVTPRLPVHVSTDPADANAAEVPIAQIPDELLHNLNPARYCESDHLSRAAQSMFGALPPGFARVRAIEQWIHDNITCQIGSTQATTTARDVFVQRAGVCRDFAHLGVTFCRALNIPARLVVGHAGFTEPPPDFHAEFEAYLGRRWVMFKATKARLKRSAAFPAAAAPRTGTRRSRPRRSGSRPRPASAGSPVRRRCGR